jgi:hypothetical protein
MWAMIDREPEATDERRIRFRCAEFSRKQSIFSAASRCGMSAGETGTVGARRCAKNELD